MYGPETIISMNERAAQKELAQKKPTCNCHKNILRMKSGLLAIANMKVSENTNFSVLARLCITIAQTTLENLKKE